MNLAEIMGLSEHAGTLPFVKMQGCGNDFIVIPDPHSKITPDLAMRLCDRRFGIGADGVLTIVDSTVPEAKYRMIIYNADGSMPEMCGNGIRCVALYLADNGLAPSKGEIAVDTAAGLIKPEIIRRDGVEAIVKVNMGTPSLYNPQQVLIEPKQGLVQGTVERLPFTFVGMGNPHAVIFTDNLQEYVEQYGKAIEARTDIFPEKVNVEFVKVNSPEDLTMRVFERGVGETLACGTGACAAVVAATTQNYSKGIATVHLLGGALDIFWNGPGAPIFMQGPAKSVYTINPESVNV